MFFLIPGSLGVEIDNVVVLRALILYPVYSTTIIQFLFLLRFSVRLNHRIVQENKGPIVISFVKCSCGLPSWLTLRLDP